MIPFKEKKIDNAICFFAFEHKKRTRNYLTQTVLYKYLGLLDFSSIKKTGEPALGLEYKAMKMGTVPYKIWENRSEINKELYAFKLEKNERGNEKYIIIAKKPPYLGCFSNWEISEMERIVEILADKSVKTPHIIEANHQEIPAWGKTWNKQQNAIIDYGDPTIIFDDDILRKNPEELTTAEEHYLTCLALKDDKNWK